MMAMKQKGNEWGKSREKKGKSRGMRSCGKKGLLTFLKDNWYYSSFVCIW